MSALSGMIEHMFDARRRRATEIALQQLRLVVRELEPGELSGADAVALTDVFAEFERLGAAGKARCAARAADTNQWRHGNDKSAADWLAKRTGTTLGAAREALAAAALPELADGELTL